MADFFPLYIFPEGSLSASVITTVWVGVLVVVFFNLRLGWLLSGLVVPGYLAPLILAKPWAASVIIIEGIITYLVVWLCSEFFSRWGYWSSVFGRDRFFALLLVSVAVRIGMDGWILPIVGEIINNEFGIQFDYRNNLHSFGLIIVALVANQFWKSGVIYGIFPQLITIGVTCLLIRFGLMEFTNFSLNSLSYMYEDTATSMLASPKAYIILITTAFLASRMNLHYGWDFNGILIPALFALQWYQPTKILTSCIEAFVILGLSTLILKLPVFKRITIEGGRKLLLFFNVGFAYKFALGYALLWWMPEVKVTDFFGFGYLLATLIAIKMHDKEIVVRLSRALLQTSLTAVAMASLIGFSLTFLPQLWSWPIPQANTPVYLAASLSEYGLDEVIRQDKMAMYGNKSRDSVAVPLPQEMEVFAQGVRTLLEYAATGNSALLDEGKSYLVQVNYRVDLIQERYLYLQEHLPRRGWGSYAINIHSDSQLVVEVPAPLDERNTMEAGAKLFSAMNAKALAIAGSNRRTNADGTSDVLTNYRTMFQSFHRQVARNDVLQIRGQGSERHRNRVQAQPVGAQGSLGITNSSIWVKHALPPGLKLGMLRDWIGSYHLEWKQTPLTNLQRDTTREGFAELVLSHEDLRKILFRTLLPEHDLIVQEHARRIDGYLQDWLLGNKKEIAASGTNSYIKPQLEELLFLDEEIVKPLLGLMRTEYQRTGWTETGLEALGNINVAAGVLGYQLIFYRHVASGKDYLILAEKTDQKTRRYWGTYVFRLGSANPFIVQVPRPGYEINSFEYGLALFESLRAKAVLIAGASPNANTDKSADLIRMVNKENVFNLVSQVIQRESAAEPLLLIQSRAFAIRADLPTANADVLLSVDSGVTEKQNLSPLQKRLLRTMDQHGLDSKLVDGSIETAGYEVGFSPQALYLKQSANTEFAMLWLSPLTRANYQQQTENRLMIAQFDALDIVSYEKPLFKKLTDNDLGLSSTVPEDLRRILAEYLETHDILILSTLLSRWPDYSFERLIDIDSKQAFMLVYNPSGKLAMVANLVSGQMESIIRVDSDRLERDQIAEYINSRSVWLEFVQQNETS